MKRNYLLVTVFFVAVAQFQCFGQQDVVFLEPQKAQSSQVELQPKPVGREEKVAIDAGLFMGGGGLFGADLEFMLSKRLALQFGTGFWPIGTATCSFNFHLKPYINSSFVSLQYYHLGFGGNYIGSTLGPMFSFRAKKIFQAGAGYGYVLSKGPLWNDAYKEDVQMLIWFNIGLYFPLQK